MCCDGVGVPPTSQSKATRSLGCLVGTWKQRPEVEVETADKGSLGDGE